MIYVVSFVSARTFFYGERKCPYELVEFFVFVFISGLAADLAKGREETSRSEIRDNCAVLGS